MIKCKGCGCNKYHQHRGIIWLSEDGYCSVCNHKLKNRIRKKTGMDKFIKTKKISEVKEYKHLDRRGRKPKNKKSEFKEL